MLATLPVLLPLAATIASPQESLEVGVELRVELVSTIARLAGFGEYNEEVARSPYSAAVDARFAGLRGHPAVLKAQALRGDPGLSHEALVTLALHLDPETLEERFDFLEHPGRLVERWKPGDARDFAELVRRFASDARFGEFFEENGALYRACEERLRSAAASDLELSWFDEALGGKSGATFRLVPALLIGGHNYGVGVTLPAGSEELSPCIGAWKWDAAGVPLYGEDSGWIVPHEFTHSYTNPLVERHLDALAPFGADLFPPVEVVMRQQAYDDWKVVLGEALTRACVLRYLLATKGRAAAQEQALYDVQHGFTWVPDLAKLLERYESDRERYPTLAEFMPEVVAFVDEQAGIARELEKRRPHLVSITPANGATDLLPGATEIVLVFDRAMRRGSYAMITTGAAFPEVTGTIAYDAEAKVLTVPVTLEPRTTYGFLLNSATSHGFASREGVPLVPVHVEFRTGP